MRIVLVGASLVELRLLEKRMWLETDDGHLSLSFHLLDRLEIALVQPLGLAIVYA